eukprot:CAMPEP_0202906688 /NCGR_PEP_ID=MMETSP1392-20130828/39999_1 /ASSEMBLY_ACC=CAM_ASM_000868 /TAXON_ID=225041 /ORGANISM="Chlamydomonas chlamydogama, Strain SAG 11-48b" /LENGTH=216 /DNA_ID=CAMNT_0049595315 /DNA_START=161 /DNA_END=808 /DNA_ORIENTATION=+
MLEQVMSSLLLLPGLEDCSKTIVCDGYKLQTAPRKGTMRKSGWVTPDKAERYEQYKAAVQQLMDTGHPGFRNTQLLVLPQHTGCGYGVRAALQQHTTPYALVVQHDRMFVRGLPIAHVVAAMEADLGLKYVGFMTTSTVNHRSKLLGRISMSMGQKAAEHALSVAPKPFDGFLLQPLYSWYDSTHLARRDLYLGFIFPGRHCAKGGFIEDRLAQHQ